MQELIKVIGKQKIGYFEFTGIEGGFGEGKKAMMVKDIAVIHETDVRSINQTINRNLSRFVFGKDILDLKQITHSDMFLDYGITKAQWGNANNIYILSERGYAKLLKILEDDKAWEIYDELVDNYFNMRQAQSKLPTNPMEVLELTFAAQKQANEKLDKVDNRVTDLEENVNIDQGDYSYLTRRINKAVFQELEIKRFSKHKKQVDLFYKDINKGIHEITGVKTRSKLKQKQFDAVDSFITNWKPSTATITLAEQIELAGEE